MVSRASRVKYTCLTRYHADKIAKESLTYLDIYPAPELKTPDTLNLPHADRPEVLRVNDLVKPSR